MQRQWKMGSLGKTRMEEGRERHEAEVREKHEMEVSVPLPPGCP